MHKTIAPVLQEAKLLYLISIPPPTPCRPHQQCPSHLFNKQIMWGLRHALSFLAQSVFVVVIDHWGMSLSLIR